MNEILTQPSEIKSRFDLAGRGPIVVDGATGYLGSHLVAALAASGADIRCLVHKGSKAEDVQVLKDLGAKVFVGELTGNDEQAVGAFKDASVAVHLIGSIAPKKGMSHDLLPGILVFNNFLAGFLSLVSIFIAYMVIGGILAIIAAFRIRAFGERLGTI